MPFEFPVDKLGVINRALSQCGDNVCAVADDGSDEWNTASPAYEMSLGYLMENHGWGFATDVRMLQAAANPPNDDRFDTAYPLPDDLIHLIWVRMSDMPTVYDILAGQLVLNAQGGPPPPIPALIPGTVTIKGVFQTNASPQAATPTFVLSLIAFVMSGIYRGLHEDPGEADKLWQFGEQMAQRARTRHDQQKPKRAMFNSRISATRRVRHPWPSTPGGWGGTDVPS